MTMSISNYGELALLNTLRGTSYSAAGSYVKLHLGDSGEDGTANAAANTSRQSITFSAASAGAMATSSGATWTNVSTTETYSHWSLWDAATAGNCLWTGALTTSAAVVAGDTFQITSLTLTLD
jgi:hypothetical protein